MDTEHPENRRAFLISAGRYGLAALLSGGILALLTRGGAQCLQAPACSVCGEFSRCNLPQAKAAREDSVEGDGRV